MCEYLYIGKLAYGEYYHFLDFANYVGESYLIVLTCTSLSKTKVWYNGVIFHV